MTEPNVYYNTDNGFDRPHYMHLIIDRPHRFISRLGLWSGCFIFCVCSKWRRTHIDRCGRRREIRRQWWNNCNCFWCGAHPCIYGTPVTSSIPGFDRPVEWTLDDAVRGPCVCVCVFAHHNDEKERVETTQRVDIFYIVVTARRNTRQNDHLRMLLRSHAAHPEPIRTPIPAPIEGLHTCRWPAAQNHQQPTR